MPFGLSDTTVAIMRGILSNYPELDKAIVYGSRAKGNYKPGSDIDLTLVGCGLSHPRFLRILEDFEESSIPYMVDLSLFDGITDEAMRDHILRRGQVFYQKDTK